ncbi:MAG TPA: pyridoxamine 5'-phosphate oxidase family protein [Rhizomicrobium sp.]|nr:pyridoxamine 5'-phosphate oxidase family protein [Rhizomicrobium sp.]
MSAFGLPELLAYMRARRLVVVSTVDANSQPQSALVGIAVTEAFELVFDTLSSTRKHANLLARPQVAVVFSGPGEQTLQYEGEAFAVSLGGEGDAPYRAAYYEAWPDGRERLGWKGLAYWAVRPIWARYSDFDIGPLIREFRWRSRARE